MLTPLRLSPLFFLSQRHFLLIPPQIRRLNRGRHKEQPLNQLHLHPRHRRFNRGSPLSGRRSQHRAAPLETLLRRLSPLRRLPLALLASDALLLAWVTMGPAVVATWASLRLRKRKIRGCESVVTRRIPSTTPPLISYLSSPPSATHFHSRKLSKLAP